MFKRWLAAKEEEYYVNLARVLAAQQKPIDQRVIDYKRGYWHAARVLARKPAQALADLTSELEEGDEA